MYFRRIQCRDWRWGLVFQPSKYFIRPRCNNYACFQSLCPETTVEEYSSHDRIIRRHLIGSFSSRGSSSNSYTVLQGPPTLCLKSTQFRVYSSESDQRNASEDKCVNVNDGANFDKGKNRQEKFGEDVKHYNGHATVGEQDQEEWLNNEKLAVEIKKSQSHFLTRREKFKNEFLRRVVPWERINISWDTLVFMLDDNGDRVKYIGPSVQVEADNRIILGKILTSDGPTNAYTVIHGRALSKCQRGEVYEVKGDQVAVLLDISEDNANEAEVQEINEEQKKPPIYWIHAKDIEHDPDAQAQDCYIAIEALCEVLGSKQPLIVYFPDSSWWPHRLVPKSNQSEFVQKVQEMFDQLSDPVVFICGQNKVQSESKEIGKFTMILPNLGRVAKLPLSLKHLTEGLKATKRCDDNEMYKLFTNILCLYPPKGKDLLITFNKQLEDWRIIISRSNVNELHKVLEEHGLSCRDLLHVNTDKQSPMFLPFSTPSILELIRKQHWSKLKPHLGVTKPVIILEQLLDAGVDSEIVLRFFRWSRKELKLSYGLEITSKILHTLANAKRYSKVRSFLDDFVKNEKHTVSSIFHTLLLCGDQSCANTLIVDMLILAYVRNLELSSAYEAFKRAQDYGFKLSINSCNPLLSALVQQNEIGDVEHAYKNMIKRRIKPNLMTFNIFINGLCKAGKLNKVGDIIEDMKAWGFSPDVVTYNTIIDGYCKKGKAGKMYKADIILKEMFANKIYPNEITFNTLINGFCKDENVLAAKKALEEMQRQGLKPDSVTYSSLIHGLCNDGKLEEAVAMWDEMMGLGLKPSVVTFNALINGFCKKRMIKEAMEFFDDITKQVLVPNAITFNTLIDAYCKDGMMEEAFALRSSMLDEGIFPNVSTYNCLIAGLFKNGNIRAAKELLNEMEDKGLRADLVTYNILIGGWCKEKESRQAEKLLTEMFNMGVKPNHVTYNTLMHGYCMEGNLKAALNVRTWMEKEGKRANVVTYNVLIKGFCELGKLEDANELLNEMLEKGLAPNRTTYDIIRVEMMEKGFIPDIEGHLYSFSGTS